MTMRSHSESRIRMSTIPRQIALTLIVIHLIAGLSVAGEPKIRLPEVTFDFGYTPSGLKAYHRYWLVNDGDDTLKIQRVKPGCGCTTVPLPSNVISPGDSVPLDLEFDTQKFKGKVHKSVAIYSNEMVRVDTATTNVRKIYFTGMIEDSYGPVKVTPPTAYLDTLGKTEQVITIANSSADPLTLSVTSPPPDYLLLQIPNAEVPAAGKAQLVLKPGPQTPIGAYNGSLTLRLEGKETFSLTIPIYGMGYFQ